MGVVQDFEESLGVKQAPREGAYEREGEDRYVLNRYNGGTPKTWNYLLEGGPLVGQASPAR